MTCINPMTVTKKDKTTVLVPCSRCLACRITRRNNWIHRLETENLFHKDSIFVTLTYNNFFNKSPNLNYTHLQNFFNNLRSSLNRAGSKDPIKYFAVGEYGGLHNRKHFHIVLFGLSVYDKKFLQIAWPCGIIDVKPLVPNRIKYCLKYLDKSSPKYNKCLKELGFTPSKAMISKGIGRKWLMDNYEFLKEHPYYYRKGRMYSLPKYYTKLLDSNYTFFESIEDTKKYRDKNCSSCSLAYAQLQKTISQLKGEISSMRQHHQPIDDLDSSAIILTPDYKRIHKKYVDWSTLSGQALYRHYYECVEVGIF